MNRMNAKEQQKMKNAAGIAFGSTARTAMECSFVMSENYMYTNLGIVPIMRQLRKRRVNQHECEG